MVQVQPAPKVQGNGEAVDKAVEGVTEAVNKVIDLHDFGVQQEAELGRRKNAQNMNIALRKRMALAHDNPNSFYTPDGKLDEDKMRAFISEWQQKNNSASRDFWRGTRQMEDDYRLQADNENLEVQVASALAGQELQHRRKVFEENLGLAVANEDWPGAKRSLKDAWKDGQITETRYKLECLKVDQMQEKKRLEAYNEAVRKNPAAAKELGHEVLMGLAKPEKEADERPVVFDVNADVRESVMTEADGRLAAATLTLGERGGAYIAMSDAPSDESVLMAANASSKGAYTLADHQRDVRLIAARVMTNPNFAELTDSKKAELVASKAKLVGGADHFFGGNGDEYEGWLLAQVASVKGMGSAVDAADRMLKGHAGQAGIDKLLVQEVTDAEIAAAWEEGELPTGEALKKHREAMYQQHKQEWLNATGETADEVMRVGDVNKFWKWYMGKGGLYAKKRMVFSEGLRNVYAARAMDAVLHLRGNGEYELRNGQVVKLDGKSDWAVEQRVMKDVLQAPVTRAEYGTMDKLAKLEAKLEQDRRARAQKYAGEARDAEARVAERNKEQFDASLTSERAQFERMLVHDEEASKRQEKEQKKAEAEQKKREKAKKQRYAERAVYKAKWDGQRVEADAAPVVTVPLDMYKEIEKALDAGGKGFYVVLPGGGHPVPVKADEKAKGILFNRTCLPRMKRGKLTDAETATLVNGAAVRMQFTTNASTYDF